jgi:cytochrome P450
MGENREANKAKSIPFGLGNRSCVGRDLAWYELYMLLADLIRHFNFELVDKVLTPNYQIVYRPKEKTFRMKVSRKPY